MSLSTNYFYHSTYLGYPIYCSSDKQEYYFKLAPRETSEIFYTLEDTIAEIDWMVKCDQDRDDYLGLSNHNDTAALDPPWWRHK